MAASVASICTGLGAQAQTNGLDPANLPPASFEGREFVDTAGCAFLRSTFGGEVTWVPRYGPDRNPVCDLSPTDFASAPPAAPVAEAAEIEMPVQDNAAATDNAASDMAADLPEADAVAPDAAPEAPRGRIEVVGPVNDPVRRPAPSYLGKEPTVSGLAPRRQAAAPVARAKPRYPVADASGRHPSCPGSAPYGQLVDTMVGRKMVRCVTSPSLFLSDYDVSPVQAAAPAPRAAVGQGARVQVGSFGVASNAHRLVARLKAHGLPASAQFARGLMVVTVGPFASGSSAHQALSQVRTMGFGDAFLRR